MSKPFKGVINVDSRDSTPDWEPYLQPVAPAGAPNVLYIVLDDVGYSAMEPWGGLIETPNITKLAARGLTYTNWHTTALCSPTRSSLLNGRNHTTNGMACIAEATTGFPNSNGHIPFECATIAEVLGERGWNTYMLGKWHLVAADEMNMASTKRNWPVGRGFERYYGFLGGETNQWYPDLIYDNHPVDQPASPEDGYHLTTDLTDKAIEFIRDAKMIVPDKPFFMYFAPGATHAPHHARRSGSSSYRGKFDMGYERYRELVFERQKQAGIFPADSLRYSRGAGDGSGQHPQPQLLDRRRDAHRRRGRLGHLSSFRRPFWRPRALRQGREAQVRLQLRRLGTSRSWSRAPGSPPANVILGASFMREGDSMPTTGTLSLFVNDEKVGEGTIMTQPGNFSLVGEGLNVRAGNRPSRSRRTTRARAPTRSRAERSRSAIVDVSGEQYVDLELEALALMKRE